MKHKQHFKLCIPNINDITNIASLLLIKAFK